ncbi:L-rhamnose-binding lectin CSL1-like [Gouania willdenowi]|uniref:L-rhamnose-binding lectin CSL1-like n=1 Tax=Gouania willdenowi TaxID=441366 RepID=UPI00105568AC|nr:L-rhamnose-binding lectin CSL1-like [Gouania willdenowi]
MELKERVCVALLLLVSCCCCCCCGSKKVLTCDPRERSQILRCDDGLILVDNVTVSHRESESCVDGVRPEVLKPLLCSPARVNTIVRELCNGYPACVVSMDRCHAATPCRMRCLWMETRFSCMANSDSYTRHICQQSKTELYCEGSQVIKILRANYGRTDESVCSYSAPYSESPNTACSGPSALKVMRERCDGKKSCSVRSSNHVFANPCPGTRKYLEYAYSCVVLHQCVEMDLKERVCVAFLLLLSSSSCRSNTVLTCDLRENIQQLQCEEGLIVVDNVTVSHRASESCVEGVRPRFLKPPLCSMTLVKALLQQTCNGRSSCSVMMDLCTAIGSCDRRCVWMETQYTCVSAVSQQVCQQRKAELHCGSKLIHMLMANYGRSSEWVCTYSAPYSQPADTACGNPEASLQLMKDRCDGKHSCSLPASNHVFSNPCPGTKKYLEYSYTCVHT